MEHSQSAQDKAKDPFGRMIPDDGSQDRFRDMPDITILEAAIGPKNDNRPEDVAKIEIMLDQVGLLDLQETDGPTGFYGERLRQAINILQRQSRLKETGKVAPGDRTHVALQQRIGNTPRPDPLEARPLTGEQSAKG